MIRLIFRLGFIGLAVYGGYMIWELYLKDYFEFEGVQTNSHVSADISQELENAIYNQGSEQ